MTTTTDYGQIVPTTLTEEVTAALGEHEDDYDIPAIVADYRAAIQAELPEGVSVHGEGQMYGPYPRDDVDRDAVLEAVDFWAIVERHALWTTAQVAEHLGVKPNSFRDYHQRLDPPPPAPVSRQPGRGGQDLYDAAAVREWHAKRPGRGARSDLKNSGSTP